MTQPVENRTESRGGPTRAGGVLWTVLAGLLVLVGIVVPYGIMAGTALAPWTFAFWTGFGLVTVAVIVWGVVGWRDR